MMKFKSVVKTNKDLKKNGYKMIRKLHKMEKKSLQYLMLELFCVPQKI